MKLSQMELIARPFIGEVVEKLKQHGLCVLPRFFDTGEVVNCSRRFDEAFRDPNIEVIDQIYQKSVYLYPTSFKPMRKGNLTNHQGENAVLRRYSPLDKVGSSAFCDDVLARVFKDEEYYQGIRWQLVKSFTSPEVRDNAPYTLHYDRQHYYKYYTSLTKVEINDGPITFLLGGEHREAAKKARIAQKSRVSHWQKIQNTYDGSYLADDLFPIMLNAGDLLVFDSDVPHFQGELASGNVRKVVIVESQFSNEYHFGQQ